jgi:hypothetical protein
VASVVRLNVILFGESGRALRAWASETGDAAWVAGGVNDPGGSPPLAVFERKTRPASQA